MLSEKLQAQKLEASSVSMHVIPATCSMVLPEDIATSASLSFLTICSGV
jgi:hypothetical protein